MFLILTEYRKPFLKIAVDWRRLHAFESLSLPLQNKAETFALHPQRTEFLHSAMGIPSAGK